MAAHRSGTVVAAVGLCFLVFYLVVRFLFIQDLNAVLAASDVHGIADVVANLSPLLIVYLVWGYSFRLGMLLCILGGALHAGMAARELWLLVVGGGLYLATCYVPVVGYSPLFYGIQGVMILVIFLLIVRHWMRGRPGLPESGKIASDLRMIGYFFIVMATWGLCGIFGIVTFALQPEKMIERGLQSTALTLTSHVMLELSLGWLFIYLGTSKSNAVPELARVG